MTRALGIAVAAGLGILAGCRGGPSALPSSADRPVARASGPESGTAESATTSSTGASDGYPVFSATIWKRETISEEPILLRVEVTNPRGDEVKIIAPYFNSGGGFNLPLTLAVTNSAGAQLPNGSKYSATGFEPIIRGQPWWIPDGRVRAGDTEPREWRAWRIPAGATAYMWYNMLQFYPLDDPGRYHIVLKYDSKPEMLFEGGQKMDNPPKDVLCWSAEIDAGWVTVREPGPKDAAACQRLREHPEVQGVVFATNYAFGDDAGLLEDEGQAYHWPWGTTYEPYARFARAFYKAANPSPSDAAGLPLGDLLTVAAARRLCRERDYGAPNELLPVLRRDPEHNAAKLQEVEAEARSRAEGSVKTRQGYIDIAREVGDYSLLGFAGKPMEGLMKCIKADFPDWPN